LGSGVWLQLNPEASLSPVENDAVCLVGISAMIFIFSEKAGILGAIQLFKNSFENL